MVERESSLSKWQHVNNSLAYTQAWHKLVSGVLFLDIFCRADLLFCHPWQISSRQCHCLLINTSKLCCITERKWLHLLLHHKNWIIKISSMLDVETVSIIFLTIWHSKTSLHMHACEFMAQTKNNHTFSNNFNLFWEVMGADWNQLVRGLCLYCLPWASTKANMQHCNDAFSAPQHETVPQSSLNIFSGDMRPA